MLHGKNARFPPGATVYLLEGALDHLPTGEQQSLRDELASVKRYDATTDLWEVAPSRPQFGGKTVHVKEKGMRLAFCILAENALPGGGASRNANLAPAACKPKRKIKRAPAPNGSTLRGGGMIALEDIAPGEVLLREHPFLLSSTGVEHRWADRWRAYLTMMGGKGEGGGGTRAAYATTQGKKRGAGGVVDGRCYIFADSTTRNANLKKTHTQQARAAYPSLVCFMRVFLSARV